MYLNIRQAALVGDPSQSDGQERFCVLLETSPETLGDQAHAWEQESAQEMCFVEENPARNGEKMAGRGRSCIWLLR